jgi:hypothetical protein
MPMHGHVRGDVLVRSAAYVATALGAIALMLGTAWQSPSVVVLAAAYGITGTLVIIVDAKHH